MSKKTKILIDGLGLVDGHFSGIGQYILGILKGMDELIDAEILAGEKPTKVKVIIPYDKIHRFKKFGFKHIEYTIFPLPFRYMAALWHRNLMPPLDLLYGKAVYLFPRFIGMPLLFSKSMLTIYDISFELYRQYSDEGNAIFLSNGIKRSLKKTNAVITISKNAKQEIVNFYRVPSDFVSVATPATDPHLFYRRNKKEIASIKEKYEIKGDYILALSNLEPRKNLETLVDAYCCLPESVRNKASLLLVGVSGWKTDTLFDKIITRVKEGYDIIRPSEYIEDIDKPAILSGARVLVYPSHYEGFGMPPLEALACGTPVITSNNSSLPEVVGSAGTMLNSTDIEGFSREIERHLTTNDISESALNEGPDRAELFSWQKSAQVYFDEARRLK